MDKSGDYKWSIMLSLILGLLILSFSLYFIFNELWTDDDADRQICRQSIQLRNLLPNVEKGGIDWTSFKSDYPLRCKTHVVEIIKSDVVVQDGVMEAERKIAEAMAECWALYDKGDANAFPAEVFKYSTCVPCARIHLTDEAKTELGTRTINIRNALDLKMSKDYSYYNFLRDSGTKFSAFDFGNGVSFDLKGDEFEINGATWDSEEVKLKLWDSVELKNKVNGATWNAWMGTVGISLPEKFDASKGDLLINYGIVNVGDHEGFGDYVPYLFYFQAGQEKNPFNEVKKILIFNFIGTIWEGVKASVMFWQVDENFEEAKAASATFCNDWEGIPA